MARAFNGTGQSLSLDPAPSSIKLTNNFTISVWFYQNNSGDTEQEIFSLGDSYALRSRANGGGINFFKYIGGSWQNASNFGMSIPRSTWVHAFCLASSSSGIQVWVDGTSAASNSNTSNINYGLGTGFFIGKHGNGGTDFDFNGYIAEFAMWNSTDTTKLDALRKGYSPILFRRNLVSYRPLIGRTSPDPDLVLGNNMTVNSATEAPHPRVIYAAPTLFSFSGTATATLEQEGFRWRDDNGSESTASWLAAQDTNITRPKETNTRLRMLLNATNDPSSSQYRLDYKLSTDGSWSAVPADSGNTVNATNLIENPSFGNNYTDYWSTFTSSGSPTFSRDASVGQFGSSSFKIDANGVNTDAGLIRFMTLEAGTYYLSGYIKTSGITGDAKLVMRNTTNFNADINLTVTASTQDWTRVSGSYTVASTTNFDVLFGLGPYGAPSQGVAWFDGIMLTKDTGAVIDYFDGSTSEDATYYYQWTGTAHNSTSQRVTMPPDICYIASSNITASGENTTAQLTAPSGKTTSNFVAGRIQDDENPTDAIDIGSGQYTEVEWCLKASSRTANGEVYQFRVTVGGVVLDTYTVTPQWTIGATGTSFLTLLGVG